MATDIAFGNVKHSFPKCFHAIAIIYIAGSDKFHSNGMCAIADNKMAMTRPMGICDEMNPCNITKTELKNYYDNVY